MMNPDAAQRKRLAMPVVDQWAYLDHAAIAPLSLQVAEAIDQWTADMSRHGATGWNHWRRNVERTRRLAARLLNADPREIGIIRNTTEGINLVAEGIHWQAGDNIVTLDSEFPSNLYPWMNLASRGVELRKVVTRNERWSLDELFSLCDRRTRLITLSWVSYATGRRNPIEAIADFANQRRIRCFVDAIQGLGVLPLDLSETPIDFLAADGHKWLLGPEGAGVLFIRSERLDELAPRGLGWNSVVHAGDYSDHSLDLPHSTARYEGGSYGMASISGLKAALEWIHEVGTNWIEDRLHRISDELVSVVESAGARVISDRSDGTRSGIVSFDLPGHAAKSVRRHCLNSGVALNARAGHVRASPHVYNNEEDLRQLSRALIAMN